MASEENIKGEEREQAGLNYARLNHLLSHLGMRALRLSFRDRYKTMTHMEWENGSLSLSQDFIKREGSSPNLTREQKEALESADINNWDVTLLVHILLSMDLKMTELKNLKQKKSEHEAFKVLENLLNSLEHISGQVIPNKEFVQQWKIGTEALLCLGVREKEIEHLRTTSKLENLECNTAALDLKNEVKSTKIRNRAKELVAAGKFQEGVQLYSEALLLVGLSTIEKSCLYSSRGQAYIKEIEDHLESLSKVVVQKYLDAAMEDVNLLIQLQPKGWSGYFLEGKCFQLQKRVKEAIDSFETALTFNPGSQEIISARDVCRFHQSDVDGKGLNELFTPSISPGSVQSRGEVLRIIQINEQMMRSSNPAAKARGCVFIGNLHLKGMHVSLDKKKAAELFLKAAKVGSPDGDYNAGLCYFGGIGVKQNIPEAVKHFETAAKQQVKAGVKSVIDNESIAKAKGMLARLYRYGIGKPRNYVTAAKWLTRAAHEADAVAATNLAGMLGAGIGIPRDLKRALQYQKLAVELDSVPEDMRFLSQLYADAGDLTQARYWHDRALRSGLPVASSERQHFENLLKLKQQEFKEFRKKLPAHVIKSEVPIQVLYDRHVKRKKPECLELMNTLQNIVQVLSNAASSYAFRESATVTTALNIAEIEQFAAKGQEYAQILLFAAEHLRNGVESIKLLMGIGSATTPASSSSPKEMLKKLALAEVAACYTADAGFAVTMSADYRAKLVEISMEFVADDGKTSDLDLHARVCRLNLSANYSLEEKLNFAKECKSLYPEERHFHDMHAKLLGLLEKYEEGVAVAEEGLKRFPGNPELLFYRACYLCATWKPKVNTGFYKDIVEGCFSKGEPFPGKDESSEEDMGTWMLSTLSSTSSQECKTQIEAYQDFIKKAPSGHRHIPEAYYWIANLHASKGDLEDFGIYYSRAADAEKELPPNFLPYDSDTKETAAQCLKLMQEDMEKDMMRHFTGDSPSAPKSLVEADLEEIIENRKLKLTDPKRIVAVKNCRHKFASHEVDKLDRNVMAWTTSAGAKGQHKQRAPSRQQIPSLKSIRFADMDPSLEQVYEGRVISLTIMEEYVDWMEDCISSVVKDDNDDFNIICFYNFDRSDPSTKQKLDFGSRIRLMNPYLELQHCGPAVIRVDDPSSVVLISSGEGNPMCRYCWKPNPGPRCIKCKTAQYCNKECQKLDWEALGHKELCKILSNRKGGRD